MATLSGIITPSNVLTATSTNTVTNKTINASNNTVTNIPLTTGVTGTLAVAKGGTGLTALGTAGQVLAVNSGATALEYVPPPAPAGTIQAIASGTLANGSKVVVNTDGTVSAVVELSASQGVGADAVFDAQDIISTDSTFDSSTNKIVIAYCDRTGPEVGTAVVGTVSGTTITFGTPVVFSAVSTDRIKIAFDSSANKVVIFYRASANGKAIVGTVSGTSISFGTEVTVLAGQVFDTAIVFDSNSNKIVIFYEDSTASDQLTAQVGTVSGTSISFGTKVAFDGNPEDISAAFDTTANKIVVCYKDAGNSSFGTCSIGTVSGTSISFGTPVVFSSDTTTFTATAYDPVQNKSVVCFRVAGDGSAKVGTVSGTSISFSSSVIFQSTEGGAERIAATYDVLAEKIVVAYALPNTSPSYFGRVVSASISSGVITFDSSVAFHSDSTNFIAIAYDTNAQKSVISYRDQSNSNFGTSNVFTAGFLRRNLTAENYIGISNAAYADGVTATIQTVGSTDDAQTGLTAGQSFFVQNNGTLGLSPASPSVFAGTAISATKLIIKG